MRSSNTQTSSDIKQLRAEVQRLGQIVKDMPAHAKSDVSNVIGLDGRELRKMARKAGKDARRYLNEKRDQAVELREEAEERITTHPFQAVGIAAGIGLLFGAVFGLTRR